MTRARLSDEELELIQARAWRVLKNGTTSGSARALANDCLRLTYIMQRNRHSGRKTASERIRRARDADMWAYMESQFSER